jgi:hypothetical protein
VIELAYVLYDPKSDQGVQIQNLPDRMWDHFADLAWRISKTFRGRTVSEGLFFEMDNFVRQWIFEMADNLD